MTLPRRLAKHLALAAGLLAMGFHVGARWTGGVAQPTAAFTKPDWMLEVQTALAASLWLGVGGIALWIVLDYYTEAAA